MTMEKRFHEELVAILKAVEEDNACRTDITNAHHTFREDVHDAIIGVVNDVVFYKGVD